MDLFYENVRREPEFINMCIFEVLESKFNMMIEKSRSVGYKSPQKYKLLMNEFKELIEEAKILNSENENNTIVDNYISMYEAIIKYPNFLMKLSKMPNNKFGKFTTSISEIKKIKEEYINSHKKEYSKYTYLINSMRGGCGVEDGIIFPTADYTIEINNKYIVVNGEVVEKRESYDEEELEKYGDSEEKLEKDIAIKALSRKYKNRLLLLNNHLNFNGSIREFETSLNKAIDGYSLYGLSVKYSRNEEQQDIENEK